MSERHKGVGIMYGNGYIEPQDIPDYTKHPETCACRMCKPQPMPAYRGVTIARFTLDQRETFYGPVTRKEHKEGSRDDCA